MAARPGFKAGLEDWECPECSNLNFGKRLECNRCKKPKPDALTNIKKTGIEIGKQASEKSKGLFSPDDWMCTKCGNVNWARRKTCNTCNAPKFTEVEERTGLGGGFNERDGVEYKEREPSDDEFDDFGRKKKKFRPNMEESGNGYRDERASVSGKAAAPSTRDKSPEKESEEEDDEDEDDPKIAAKYSLDLDEEEEDDDGDTDKYKLFDDDDEDEAGKKGNEKSTEAASSSAAAPTDRTRKLKGDKESDDEDSQDSRKVLSQKSDPRKRYPGSRSSDESSSSSSGSRSSASRSSSSASSNSSREASKKNGHR